MGGNSVEKESRNRGMSARKRQKWGEVNRETGSDFGTVFDEGGGRIVFPIVTIEGDSWRFSDIDVGN